MSDTDTDTSSTSAPVRLPMSPRQRRLRIYTGVILAVILAMVAFGLTNPFFRSAGSAQVRQQAREAILARRANQPVSPAAERARKAVQARLLFIYFYWTACFVLALGLPVLAWLDVRETLRQSLIAQRDMWREAAEESRRRREKPSGP